MRPWSLPLALAAALGALSLAGTAHAATYEVCLRIPVNVTDETGTAGELGTDGNWIARGIYVERVRAPNGALIAGFPLYASASTGCFTFSSSQSGEFDITIQSRGQVVSSNTITVRNSDGQIVRYTASFDLEAGTHAYVWPNEYIMPRVYAVYAYSIQSGFRGGYSGVDLSVWLDRDSPCGTQCNSTCSVGGDSHIKLCDGANARRFLMTHEYGHANLRQTSSAFNNDCSYTSPGDASGHQMRGLEFDSCAGMEGWANFVAAAVWNDRSGGGDDTDAWLRYWGDNNGLVPAEGEVGGCWNDYSDGGGDYIRAFADTCFGNPDMSDINDANCAGGECIGYGNELDWMRTWWDLHTDRDLPGDPLSASSLQSLVSSTGGWGDTQFWNELDAAASGTLGQRVQQAGDWNGTSD